MAPVFDHDPSAYRVAPAAARRVPWLTQLAPTTSMNRPLTSARMVPWLTTETFAGPQAPFAPTVPYPPRTVIPGPRVRVVPPWVGDTPLAPSLLLLRTTVPVPPRVWV